MKILVLDEEFPWPPDTGKRIRSLNLTRRLARNHEIHYLAYGSEGSEAARGLADLGIAPVAVRPRVPRKSGPVFYLRLLLNLMSPLPYVVSSHYSKEFADELASQLERHRPDLIVCEWSPYAEYIRSLSTPTKLIVAHNIEHLIWQRYYENETNPLKKWYIGIQYRKLKEFEQEAFRWAEGATAVSDREAEQIRSFCPDTIVTTVDNGVDLEFFAPSTEPTVSNRLVFVGSLDWRPNQDAVRYFADKIMPELEKLDLQVEIDVVGHKAPPDLMALDDRRGINMRGRVPDVRPFIRAADVYVVPLRIGGGTRLKILEALSMKKAVVSTTVGAEGLQVVDGEHLLLADDPATFAGCVKRLFDDRALNTELGEKGRRLVEDRYGWDAIAAGLDKALSRLVSTSGKDRS